MARPGFEELRKFAQSHWGLTLARGDKNARGYWNGCWRSGFVLSGQFPGSGHSCRRFATLKAVAQCLGFKRPE